VNKDVYITVEMVIINILRQLCATKHSMIIFIHRNNTGSK